MFPFSLTSSQTVPGYQDRSFAKGQSNSESDGNNEEYGGVKDKEQEAEENIAYKNQEKPNSNNMLGREIYSYTSTNNHRGEGTG